MVTLSKGRKSWGWRDAQLLNALAALAKDLVSVPDTHMAALA